MNEKYARRLRNQYCFSKLFDFLKEILYLAKKSARRRTQSLIMAIIDFNKYVERSKKI